MRRRVYVMLGFVSVALGAAGIVLPLLPTTPFVLLAAFFFTRSSERWSRWLSGHRWFGPYLRAFRDKQGLTLAQKLRIGASFTVLLALSLYVSPLPMVKWVLGVMWLFWTSVLFLSRTAPAIEEERARTE